ncbi:hypothetical protein T4B_9014 [Trichinella pseudospiralis]|uniref:Uncharacterized protein n=1 Tax=Trichinella pseudospiralis TaxID=6337 RepID=A0A0V1IYS1_TRIPS|nr:hypothetical protein T4B_9014 [Trichinella pseudospiralis]
MNIIPSIYHMIRIKKYPFDHLCFMLILTFLTTAVTLFSGIITILKFKAIYCLFISPRLALEAIIRHFAYLCR